MRVAHNQKRSRLQIRRVIYRNSILPMGNQDVKDSLICHNLWLIRGSFSRQYFKVWLRMRGSRSRLERSGIVLAPAAVARLDIEIPAVAIQLGPVKDVIVPLGI